MSDPVESPDQSAQAFRMKALSEAYKNRAAMTQDQAWSDIYTAISDTYEQIAAESERTAATIHSIDETRARWLAALATGGHADSPPSAPEEPHAGDTDAGLEDGELRDDAVLGDGEQDERTS